MTEPTSTDAVVIERTLAAPATLVWELWTIPERFAAWYGPDGATVTVAEMDVRVGGARLVAMAMDTPGGPMEMWFGGVHREVTPARRLVYSEAMTDSDGNPRPADQVGLPEGHPVTTEVQVDLTERNGSTTMTLSHVGIPAGSPGEAGWTMAIDKLEAHLATLD